MSRYVSYLGTMPFMRKLETDGAVFCLFFLSPLKAIFKRCGPITEAKLMKSPGDTVQVRVIYKHEKDAQAAVAKFNGQPADGRTLEVKIVGGVNASLGGRLGIAVQDLGSVDVLMDDSPSSKNSS